MSDRSVVSGLRGMGAAGALLAVTGTGVFGALGHIGLWWLSFTAFVAVLATFFAVLVWLASPRQPRNAVVWTMAASAVLGGAYVFLAALSVLMVADQPDLIPVVMHTPAVPSDLPTPVAWMRLVAEPAAATAVFLPLTFGLLLFPDGTLPSPAWRWVGGLTAAAIALWAFGLAWGFRPSNTQPSDSGPMPTSGNALALLAAVLALVALVRRYRRSSGSTRDQFKWVVWGAAILMLGVIIGFAFGDTTYGNLAVAAVMVSEITFISAFGIAVGRYELYDVDKVISRTVVYGSVVGVLSAVYAAGVVVLRGLSPWEGDLAVAVSTLAVAALFNPLRRRVQRVVDRRFYRSRYDARQVLESFAASVRNQVDLDVLTDDLLGVVDDAMRPAHTAVWLRNRRPS